MSLKHHIHQLEASGAKLKLQIINVTKTSHPQLEASGAKLKLQIINVTKTSHPPARIIWG